MSSFVQFIHPGDFETLSPKERSRNFKDWHYRDRHSLKPLRANGQYVNDIGDEIADDLLFWGEWEPEANVSINQSGRVFLPNMVVNSNNESIANPFIVDKSGLMRYKQHTDPFVFGEDGFLYFIEGQVNNGNNNSLRRLDVGDIIVFGSNRCGIYYVDTVFVVGAYSNYSVNHIIYGLSGSLASSARFADLMWQGIKSRLTKGIQGYPRCYKGATPDNRIDEMYSFVPCMIANKDNIPFIKPALSNQDLSTLKLSVNPTNLVSDNLKSNFHITTNLNPGDMKLIWDRLYDVLITRTGLLPGTRFGYQTHP